MLPNNQTQEPANLLTWIESSRAERLIAAIEKLTEVLQRIEAKEYPSFYRLHLHHAGPSMLQRVKAPKGRRLK